jgi:hypothetical protein
LVETIPVAGPPSKVEVHWIRKLLDSSEYALNAGCFPAYLGCQACQKPKNKTHI